LKLASENLSFISKQLIERFLCNSESDNISKTLLVNSESEFTKNQFCQSCMISLEPFISNATTGTPILIASIIVIQNESILEGKRQTSDFCRLSIIDTLSNNHKNDTFKSSLYLSLKKSNSFQIHHIFNLSQST
jgi:hypothetical protein